MSTVFDHLLRFTDEASAIAALPQYRTQGSDDAPAAWMGQFCNPDGHRVYTVSGTRTVTDPETGQTYEEEVRDFLPYWYQLVSRPDVDPALAAMPECMIITDRDGGFIVQSRIPADQLAQYWLTPVPHGSHYPFGALWPTPP